jgi:hypothetical protein
LLRLDAKVKAAAIELPLRSLADPSEGIAGAGSARDERAGAPARALSTR